MFLLINGCRSKDGDFNVFSAEDDVNFGKQFAVQVQNDPRGFPLLDEQQYPEAYTTVRGITKSITQSAHLFYPDEFAWEVQIIENDSVLNAFCTPGGYIYVYTGLIKYLDSEDQLAGVLGHEIAHADLRHSTEQMTKQYGVSLLIQLIFGGSSSISNMAAGLMNLSFSRHDETQADMQSVMYLYDTNYDPRGVARFFEKLEAKGETLGPLQFLSTHPNPENRVEKIFAKWKELGSKKGERYIERYARLKKSLP
jgi:predicted Zn-dependent protease